MSDAHYRLGTDYVHMGQKDKAQEEFAIYQKLRAEHLAEVEKERAEVQQFVYSEKSPAAEQTVGRKFLWSVRALARTLATAGQNA